MNRYLVAGIFVAALALAACNTGNNQVTPTPTLGPTCQLPAGTQSALVYPAPGATGVVDNNGQIIIGSSPALPVGQSGENWQIVIVDAVFPSGVSLSGSLQNTTPPFPTPNATPSFANPTYQTQAAGAPFAANQVVQVYENNTATNCAPLLIGQFST